MPRFPIRRLSWSVASDAYVDAGAVTDTQTAYADLVFHDGKLYTFDASIRNGLSETDTILEVTPTGFDTYRAFAGLDAWLDPNSYHGMASADGGLLVAEFLQEQRRGKSYRIGFISPVTSGAVTSVANAIATYGADRLFAMAGTVAGGLAVLMDDGVAGEFAIFRLRPATDSGGGDSGGGGGKGKKKETLPPCVPGRRGPSGSRRPSIVALASVAENCSHRDGTNLGDRAGTPRGHCRTRPCKWRPITRSRRRLRDCKSAHA